MCRWERDIHEITETLSRHLKKGVLEILSSQTDGQPDQHVHIFYFLKRKLFGVLSASQWIVEEFSYIR